MAELGTTSSPSSSSSSRALAGSNCIPQQWDPLRFRQVAMLQEAPRNHGRVELWEDTSTGQYVAVKAMPLVWVHSSHAAFLREFPEENEFPWRDISLTRYLSKDAGLSSVCEFIGLFWRLEGPRNHYQQGPGQVAAASPSEGATPGAALSPPTHLEPDHLQSDDVLALLEGSGLGVHVDICLVMSYCAGGDLFTWMDRSLQMGGDRETATRPLMRLVLKAVADIHALGIAHGDLSLENVLLVDPDGTDLSWVDCRIIDFGAATGPKANGPRGKVSYQAPEMHLGADYDAFLADSFAIGVMIFTLTVGNYPWKSTRPHVCPCFKFAAERGLPAYLAKRKIKVNDQIVALLDTLSPPLVSLMSGLLSVDTVTRLTVTTALQHEWFSPGANR